MSLPPGIQDDKAQYVIPFVLDLYQKHAAQHTTSVRVPPLIVGLSAPQGAGKSVLVSLLYSTLSSPEHNLRTAVFSLDDFYLTHESQVALAKANATNPLLQHRGQPGTHDIPLMNSVFTQLSQGKPVQIPQYNKAAFSGQGDRLPKDQWISVNQPGEEVQIVLFEGWCVGFRSLPDEAVIQKREFAARLARDEGESYKGRLGHNTLENALAINRHLKQYDTITDQFDGFVHIDAADPLFVYRWRREQEVGLRQQKGAGMTDEQVNHFVDGYYPAYELYVEGLKQGVFSASGAGGNQRQIRIVIGSDRRVREVLRL